MANDQAVDAKVSAEIRVARMAIQEAFRVVGRDDTTAGERQQAARNLLDHVPALGRLAYVHPAEWATAAAALATGDRFGESAARLAKAVREQAEVYTKQARAEAAKQRAEARVPTTKEGKDGAFLARPHPSVMVQLDRKIRMVDGVPEPGDPKPTLSNVVLILESDPTVKGRIRFNDFTQYVEIDGIEKTEDLDTHVAIALDRAYGVEVPTDKVREALAYVAKRYNRYDPLVDYLNGLTWDGVHRVGTIFRDYMAVAIPTSEVPTGEVDSLGKPKTKVVRDVDLLVAMERCFFVGAVARAYAPGCKFDTQPVFVGLGGKGKSRALAALCPRPEWFSDTPIDLRDKDRFQALDGIWIYENAELDTLSNVALNRVKGFMSSAVDRYRRPYDRSPGRHPRRAAMCASTNDREWGKDRRFHPVDVRDDGVMRPDDIPGIRDQVWAEAVALYRAGAPWNLDKSQHARLMDHAEQYRVNSPWEAGIGRYLSEQEDAIAKHMDLGIPGEAKAWFSIDEVMKFLGITVDRQNDGKTVQAVGKILADKGCRKARAPRSAFPGARPRVWFLPSRAPAEPKEDLA